MLLKNMILGSKNILPQVDTGKTMANETYEKNSNQSVLKLTQLLQCLAGSRVPMRLQEIAGAINIPQTTTLRYLVALVQEGYVFQDNISGRYGLTWKLCHLGEQAKVHMSLRTISSDIISELTRKVTFGICLVIEQDMECVYLDCVYDPKFSLLRIGKSTPMHASSSGKILLSGFSDAQIDELIARRGLPKLTERTITTREQLMENLDMIRSNGYALDDEECERGLRCVAVPIYSYAERPKAALSMFGSAEQMDMACIEHEILPLLREAAAEISSRLDGIDPTSAI